MRPTNLGFRSPKEKTPDFYFPQTTFDGRNLSTTPTKSPTTFPSSKRFPIYEIEARKTGFRVGPGSYNTPAHHIKGSPVLRPYNGGKDTSNNGYYYVGDCLVYEPSLVSKGRKRSIGEHDWRVDVSHVLTQKGNANPVTLGSQQKRNPEDTPWFLRTFEILEKNKTTPEKRSASVTRRGSKSPYLKKVKAQSRFLFKDAQSERHFKRLIKDL